MGKPYDTLEEVIGIRPSRGSLAEYGVTYRQTDLLPDGSFDYENIKKAINEKTKLVTIQRSKGYQTRPTLSVERIGELIAFVKNIKPDVICMVDNCYGEFVERIEPTDVGADLIVGSLIKRFGYLADELHVQVQLHQVGSRTPAAAWPPSAVILRAKKNMWKMRLTVSPPPVSEKRSVPLLA